METPLLSYLYKEPWNYYLDNHQLVNTYPTLILIYSYLSLSIIDKRGENF